MANAENLNLQIVEHINKILSKNVLNPSLAAVFLPLLVEASSIIDRTRTQVKDAETQTNEYVTKFSEEKTDAVRLDNSADVKESYQPENDSNVPRDVSPINYVEVDPEHTNLEKSDNCQEDKEDWDIIFQLENWKRNNIHTAERNVRTKVKTMYNFDPYCSRYVRNKRKRWDRSTSSSSSSRSRSRSRKRQMQ